MFLDSKFNFTEYIKNVLSNVSKTIGLISKFRNILPRPSLIIYKSFIKPHVDYGDIIYDQAYNVSFHQKLESIQNNVALATTGAVRGISIEKLPHELDFKSLESKRRYYKLCCFYKLFRTQSPSYLFDVIPTAKRTYITRNDDKCLISK